MPLKVISLHWRSIAYQTPYFENERFEERVKHLFCFAFTNCISGQPNSLLRKILKEEFQLINMADTTDLKYYYFAMPSKITESNIIRR